MFKIIPNKKNIGAELICDLNKINNSTLKKIKSALSKYGMIYFRNQKAYFTDLICSFKNHHMSFRHRKTTFTNLNVFL